MMVNFFYDSLDTLKKVKKPTNAEVTNLVIIIFVVVIISAFLFAFMDGLFGKFYNTIYDTLQGVFDGSEAVAPVADAIDIAPSIEINPSEGVVDTE